MEKRIVYNSIITPDGTTLVSRHRHDYVVYTDKNGLEYMIDGGNDYLRRGENKDAIENSLYSDAPFEEIRKVYCRGGRGKDGKQPLTWTPLCKMSDEWLEAAFQYNLKGGQGESFANMMYVAEQDFRKTNNIKVDEKI